MEPQIKEDILQYAWRFQKFNTNSIITTSGESITVLNTGFLNHDSGPDFKEARVKIADIEWHGHVEVHIRSSDWYFHKHHLDSAYENVVLHVVWECDREIPNIKTLEIKNLVDETLLNQYHSFLSNSPEIPCQNHLSSVSDLSFNSMIDRVLIERLESKALRIHKVLIETSNDWNEAIYRTLGYNLGFGLNKFPFQKLTEIVSFKTLSKYNKDILKLEAILFGVAGFLEDESEDKYHQTIRTEFQFLEKKHQLEKKLNRSEWQFAKTRPQNFPTVRIALLAKIVQSRLLSLESITDRGELDQLSSFIDLSLSDYWTKHYDFGKKRSRKVNRVSRSTVENIMINTVAPTLTSYAKYTSNQSYIEASLNILAQLKAEENKITRKWKALGKSPNSAFESQAFIELYQNYCSAKRCLSCNIGVKILDR